MSEETNKTAEEQPQISPEEYAKLRKEAIDHLKKEITYLKVEEQYEKLQADIEEHKARRLLNISRQAQMYGMGQEPNPEEGAPMPPQQEESVAKEPAPKRKLQKQD